MIRSERGRLSARRLAIAVALSLVAGGGAGVFGTLAVSRDDAGPSSPGPAATVEPSAAATPRPTTPADGPALGAEAEKAASTSIVPVAAMAALLLLAVGYFLLVQPRRRRASLVRAADLLASDRREDLEEAERLLSVAVAAGLRKPDLADARFALGFVRAMLGADDKPRLQEAATTVAELRAAHGHDAHSAYLDLWLHARLGNHDRVGQLYEDHETVLAGRYQTKLIVSISYLRKAADHWRRREVERALHYFDLVRDFGVLREHIPGQVNDLQVVNGIQAVFDGRMEDARTSFEAARDRARARSASTLEADLGLVVCDWRSGAVLDVDAELGRIVGELSQATEGPGAEEGETSDGERQEETLLRAHAALLYCVSLLLAWLVRLRPQGDLSGDERDDLVRRAERAREADPELGDPLMVEGLIGYYFARDDEERDRAVEMLEEGTVKSKGILLPEVLDLIERERRLKEEEANALGRYLTLIRGYLTDAGVPLALRAQLKTRLEQFARFRELGEIDLTSAEHGVAPSIDDIRHRGTLLRQRIGRLVAPQLRDRNEEDGSKDLRSLLESMESATKVLNEGLEDLQRAEHELMMRTGEFLLPEEPAPAETGGGDGER